jgi:hypothetical protein
MAYTRQKPIQPEYHHVTPDAGKLAQLRAAAPRSSSS